MFVPVLGCGKNVYGTKLDSYTYFISEEKFMNSVTKTRQNSDKGGR